MRCVGYVARMGSGVVHTGLWWGTEGKSPLGRPRRRLEDNIKMDLKEIGCGGWAGLIFIRIGTGDRHL
jgi:hypothetical protein